MSETWQNFLALGIGLTIIMGIGILLGKFFMWRIDRKYENKTKGKELSWEKQLDELITKTIKEFNKAIVQKELETYEKWLIDPVTANMSARHFIKWRIDVFKEYIAKEYNIFDEWKEELALLNNASLANIIKTKNAL